MRALWANKEKWLRAYQVYLKHSSVHKSMQDVMRASLPNILACIGDGNTCRNVMGVGSGSGEMDLEMLSQLCLKHPGVQVHNEVVEPSADMLHKYKVLVAKTSNLENVHFAWNKMTASDFERHWKETASMKKMDFIHMIEMLYYVKDPKSTVLFFRSLLNKNGKLIIIHVSGESGWDKLWKTYRDKIRHTEIAWYVTMVDVKNFLDDMGIPYQNYGIPSQMDITECFNFGNEEGKLLLDFMTCVVDFSETAPPELRAGVLDLLRHPDCSKEVDGRIMFNNNLDLLAIGP